MVELQDISKIKTLIAEDHISPALISIKNLVKKDKKFYYLDRVIDIVSARFSDVKKQEILNIISESDKNIEKNRIRHALLDITQELENPNKYRWYIKRFYKDFHPSLLIALAILTASFIIVLSYYFFRQNENEPNLGLIASDFDNTDSPYQLNNDTIIYEDNDHAGNKNRSVKTHSTLSSSLDTALHQDLVDINELKVENIKEAYMFDFPTVDFKFVNNGLGTAIISEFSIELEEIMLNVKPDLYFTWDVINGNIVIIVENKGWGKAINCKFQIYNQVLEDIFPLSEVSFNKNIKDIDDSLIIINKENWIKDKLSEWQNKFVDLTEHNEQLGIKGYNIGDFLYIKGTFEDERGGFYSDDFYISPKKSEHMLYLTNNGFKQLHQIGTYFREFSSSITYVTFIDKDSKLVYPTFHEIPSGGTERFHIMLASYKSCFAKLRLIFKSNDGKIIKSKPFKVSIWSPRKKLENNRREYVDGEIIKRDTISDQYIKYKKMRSQNTKLLDDYPSKKENTLHAKY